MLVVRKGGDKA